MVSSSISTCVSKGSPLAVPEVAVVGARSPVGVGVLGRMDVGVAVGVALPSEAAVAASVAVSSSVSLTVVLLMRMEMEVDKLDDTTYYGESIQIVGLVVVSGSLNRRRHQ
jgi:hypothetical protein